MTAIPITAYEIRCDHCGLLFESCDFTIFMEPSVGLWDADGWVEDGGAHVCGGCVVKSLICVSPEDCTDEEPCCFSCESAAEVAS